MNAIRKSWLKLSSHGVVIFMSQEIVQGLICVNININTLILYAVDLGSNASTVYSQFSENPFTLVKCMIPK